MNDMILEIKNLDFGYKSEYVLEDAELNLYKGDFVALIGSNGTGKSTLIKLILNILKPLNGSIKFNIENSSLIGYVPQIAIGSNNNFPITVFELVSLSLFKELSRFKKLSGIHKDRVKDALKIVGMLDYKNRLYQELSGGQRQKVLIAKALVNRPEILILDEPTAGVDAKSRESILKLLSHINIFHKITILIVTHELDEVHNYTNKIFEIKSKKIVQVK